MPGDNETTTATAEPPAGPLVTGEPEPVPAEEQEPSEAEEPTGEGAAPGPEDEGKEPPETDAAAQFEALIDQAWKEQPDLAKKFLERAPPEVQERLRGGPAQDVDERMAELEAREARVTRQDQQNKKIAELRARWAALDNQPEFGRFNEEYARQKRQIEQGESQTLDLPVGAFNEAIIRMQQAASEIGRDAAVEGLVADLEDKLLAHPSRRYLTAEDKKQIGAAQNPVERALLSATLQLDAALQRGAPEETKREAKKRAEEEAGLIKLGDQLRAQLGKGGKRPETGKGTGTVPRDETEARNWHATGKWNTRQLREYLARA